MEASSVAAPLTRPPGAGSRWPAFGLSAARASHTSAELMQQTLLPPLLRGANHLARLMGHRAAEPAPCMPRPASRACVLPSRPMFNPTQADVRRIRAACSQSQSGAPAEAIETLASLWIAEHPNTTPTWRT